MKRYLKKWEDGWKDISGDVEVDKKRVVTGLPNKYEVSLAAVDDSGG